MLENTAARKRIPLPSWRSTAGELAGLLELPRLGLELRRLLPEPSGDGSTVFVLPGFGADDRSTWPLRQFLTRLGYDARSLMPSPVPRSIAAGATTRIHWRFERRTRVWEETQFRS